MKKAKFKDGARVKLTDKGLQLVPRNFPSRYGSVMDTDSGWVEVAFDGATTGHAGLTENDKIVNRWYVVETDLDAVETAEDVAPKRVRPSIANDLKLKPQSKTVLRHLENEGDISPMKALVVYGISRLAACINDIRNAGYKVSTKQCRDPQGHKYAQYALVK